MGRDLYVLIIMIRIKLLNDRGDPIHTQVMAERCNLDTEHILVSDIQLFSLLPLEGLYQFTSNMANPIKQNR